MQLDKTWTGSTYENSTSPWQLPCNSNQCIGSVVITESKRSTTVDTKTTYESSVPDTTTEHVETQGSVHVHVHMHM